MRAFFYFGSCSPHPDGPGFPWAFPGAAESCRATHGEEPRILPGRHRECSSLAPVFRGTSRKKKEWTGQAGCRHIIKDSPWRVNSLCGSQGWVIHSSQNEMLILSSPDLWQFPAARAPVWQDQFKPAGPEHSAVAAVVGLSMSHLGGWINEQGWSCSCFFY